MFQNTQLAMEQLAEFMQSADENDILDMRNDELRAMQALFNQCESFINLVAEFDDRRQQLLDALEDADATEAE
jgi:hypothetical protein